MVKQTHKAKIIDGKKQCRLCEKWIDTKDFGMFTDDHSKKKYINSRCKKCAYEVTKKWNVENRTEIIKRQRARREINKNLVFKHYGKRCNCCGETNELFLTLDHVNNDGALHRRSDSRGKNNTHAGGFMYAWLVKNNYPTTIQILCFNCNCGRQRNKGICPHKIQ